MKNTGISYEKIVQQIFFDILNQEQVENLKVEHNITLSGKTGTHQIDVYWEFKAAGIIYGTIVQAKDWKKRVNQGEILKFKAILDDLPGQLKGVFITSTGYQSGAKDIAKKNGIIIYELRKPTTADWNDKITGIDLTVGVITPIYTVDFILDSEWVKCRKKELQINDKIYITPPPYTDNTELIDDRGQCIETLIQLMKRISKQSTVFTHKFTTDTFIVTSHNSFPVVKVLGVNVSISNSIIERKHNIDFKIMVKFILKNILEDTEKVISKDY